MFVAIGDINHIRHWVISSIIQNTTSSICNNKIISSVIKNPLYIALLLLCISLALIYVFFDPKSGKSLIRYGIAFGLVITFYFGGGMLNSMRGKK